MDFETVIYDVSDGVARITMNRPDKRNALNHQLRGARRAARHRRVLPAHLELPEADYRAGARSRLRGRRVLAVAVRHQRCGRGRAAGHPAVKMGGVSSMPLWQVALGLKQARYLLMTGRTVDGREAERIGLVTMAVPAAELDATVDGIVADCLEVPFEGALMNKEALNTSLEIMGVGALFRYHGQMNALGRLRDRSSDGGDQFAKFRG